MMAKCVVKHIGGLTKRLFLCLFVGLYCISATAQENPWYFGIRTNSSNFWTSKVTSIGEIWINYALARAINGAATFNTIVYNYHYMSIDDRYGSVDFSRNNPYGFTAYDLFNDLEAGLKAGWQGEDAPIGIGGYVSYGFNQYHLRSKGAEGYGNFKIQSLHFGLDLTISPVRYWLEEYGWCPVAEVGGTYVKPLSCKTPYGSDASQANSGFRSRYAIGVQFGEDGKTALMLCMDMAHYDLLDAGYTVEGTVPHPFEGFKSKDMNFGLQLRIRLFED